MSNEFIFFFASSITAIFILVSARLGLWALFGAVAVLSIMENLFITKAINVFGFCVTASDIYEIGLVFGLNLIQEFFGQKRALQGIGVYALVTVWFAIFGQIHLWFLPAADDVTHFAFAKILEQNPRVAIASVVTSALSLILDWALYAKIRRWLNSSEFWVSSVISTVASQLFDTAVFTVLALYGVYSNLWEIFLFSFLVKLMSIIFVNPFGHFAKMIGVVKDYKLN